MDSTESLDGRYDDAAAPTAAPATPAEWDALIGEWDEIHHGYHLGDAPAAVLECARHLEASVATGGPETALWTLGLLLIGPYVVYARPDATAEARVRDVLAGVGRALGDAPCDHPAHPCDDGPPGSELDAFRRVLEMLAHPERDPAHETEVAAEKAEEDPDDEWLASWYEGRLTRDVWACPQNLAGLARSFAS
ncbi:hypothetical protein [Streptomyces sp. NPDC017993]|uniref:hypothetical protein n=1 Tax=Streptomyces sp. NPDC017993 TaxID=3365027 RepID=UPI0037BAA084